MSDSKADHQYWLIWLLFLFIMIFCVILPVFEATKVTDNTTNKSINMSTNNSIIKEYAASDCVFITEKQVYWCYSSAV